MSALPEVILEKSTPVITAALKDENDAAITSAQLGTLTLTLFSLSDPALPIVNSRNAQNVLNQNGVSVDANGVLTWALTAADTAILDDSLSVEVHRAIFAWTYGSKTGKEVIDMKVKNLQKVT